jgi:hypothetical protein
MYSISGTDNPQPDERVTQTGEDLAQMGEIEVTEAMIQAGANELAGFDPEYDYVTECAEKVIRAALSVRTGS